MEVLTSHTPSSIQLLIAGGSLSPEVKLTSQVWLQVDGHDTSVLKQH